MQPIALDLDGFTDLPAGLFASVCTSLQAFALPPGHQPVALPQDFALQRLGGGDLARYRTLFRAAGEPWLWFTRLTWSDDRLAGVIGDDRVEAFALAGPAGDAGLLELDWRNEGEVELVYLALVPVVIGKGLGRALLDLAMTEAFGRGATRFFLRTTSLDHPGALDFYRRAGLAAYRRQLFVTGDPRLSGVLPRHAAPQIPLIDPQGEA